ncbi:MAG: protein-methionine-sulfoxide reductase heme-binding subunit MsrQ [Candidatus Sulfomarinibacteraceae bacterium]
MNAALRRVPTWPVYALGALPPFWFFYLGLTGGLGVEPIKELEHRLGEIGLQALILALAVTPIRRFTGISLLRFRRAIGLIAFYYVTCHLLAWLVLDVRDPARIWQDILKRPYITIGMVAFVLLVPLAVTSNDRSVRKLGAAVWKRLHWLAYPATILAAVHFVMLVKGWQIEPLVYLGVILGLLLARIRSSPRIRRT